jgi:kinesin family member C1
VTNVLPSVIQEGEMQRRKMHNQIQELRGNVRVYARVRPFLPSDGVSDNAPPCIEVNPHDDSVHIAKRGVDGTVLDSHSFPFDKCFPPSSGQETVFLEISEFVQSGASAVILRPL